MFRSLYKVMSIAMVLVLLPACFNHGTTSRPATRGVATSAVQPSDNQPAAAANGADQQSAEAAAPATGIKQTPYCSAHVLLMNDDYLWSEDGSTGYNFWTAGNKHLSDLVGCGWDINAANARGIYPVMQALEVYNESPDMLRDFMTYKPSFDVRDPKGHDLYSVALAVGTIPDDVLDQIRAVTSADQQQRDEAIVRMTLHGSEVTIDELKDLAADGIDLNEDMTDYSYLGDSSELNHDWETGTILGSALRNGDTAKVKWLLEHGADAKQEFGVSEFRTSPLCFALDGDLAAAELLLEHGADANETIRLNPGFATLSAYYACYADKSKLLEKYGGTEWYFEDEGKDGMQKFTKEERLKMCVK